MANGERIATEIGPLPFGIAQDRLAETTISFRVTSTKMMSGFDEIRIKGTGEIILSAADTAADAPREVSGRVEPRFVAQLLQLMRAEGIENWDDHYPPEHNDYVAKVLAIWTEDIQHEEVMHKEVAVCRPEFPEFSRVFGAMKMVVSMARPELLAGGFFSRI